MSSSQSPEGATRVVSRRKESFYLDELVVALPYADLVRQQLEAWGGHPRDAGSDRRLGLARIRLDARAVATLLRREGHPDARSDDAADTDLDVTMRCLRGSFRRDHAGWVPTLGKNRVMSHPAGSYVIDMGGTGGRPDPVPGYVIDMGGAAGAPTPLPVHPTEGGEPGRQDGVTVVPLRGDSPGFGVRVGVVDTRLAAHPWLAGGYVAAAADLLPMHPPSPLPWQANHGTFVTGLVLRQAPGAIVELRGGLDDDATQDSWTLARTIADLSARSADVVNLSLECQTDDDEPPLVLGAALAALGPRTVVVAAAGNHGHGDEGPCPPPSWPAALDHVIAVGALDGAAQPAGFTPQAPWVDAMAPGVDVVSTYFTGPGGRAAFARWSGTSFAAAAVSGAIAARVPAAGSARQAWRELRQECPQDDRGRPVIPLTRLPYWPADGLTGEAGVP